jgi:threonine aldolase
VTPLDLVDDAAQRPPQAMAARLAELTAAGDVAADHYGFGGPVPELEAAIARLLGKETAVMFPTGTLANLMGIRSLAEGRAGARLIVHRDSHVFNDAGDDATHSAGVTMLPLAGEGASFSAAQVAAEIERAATARVPARICGVMIETPNRRHAGRRFDPALAAGVIETAQAAAIPLFLDGARLFIEAAWSDRTPAEVAAPFELVYMSLYKYLDAPFGAVLAGSSERLAGLAHERRRWGGGLYQMWPAALLALHALPDQAAGWAATRAVGSAVFAALRRLGSDVFRHPEDGNVLRLPVRTASEVVRARAEAAALRLPAAPAGDHWALKMNDTWRGREPEEIARTIAAVFA